MLNSIKPILCQLLLLLASTPTISENLLPTNPFTYIAQPTNTYIHLLFLGGYRYYNPNNGTFLKQDNYSPFHSAYTINRFNYSAGNPIMKLDSSGHIPIDMLEEIIEEATDVESEEEVDTTATRQEEIPSHEHANHTPTSLSSDVKIENGENVPINLIPYNKDPTSQEDLQIGMRVLSHRARNGEIHAFSPDMQKATFGRGICPYCKQPVTTYQNSLIIGTAPIRDAG